jgi:hypothetical protein
VQRRILVLVLATDVEPWRTIQQQGQRGTWAGDDADVPILWLHGHSRGPERFLLRAVETVLRRLRLLHLFDDVHAAVGRRAAARPVDRVGDRVQTRVPEDYVMANAKTVAGLRHLLATDPFDFLLRTNSSTYVDLGMLQRWVEAAPSTRYYAGTPWTLDGMEYATGTSILLSRDLVELAANDPEWDFSTIDDVAFGRSMQRAGVPLDPVPRVDVMTDADLAALDESRLATTFVVRCRGAQGREHDVVAMRRIHELVRAHRAG